MWCIQYVCTLLKSNSNSFKLKWGSFTWGKRTVYTIARFTYPRTKVGLCDWTVKNFLIDIGYLDERMVLWETCIDLRLLSRQSGKSRWSSSGSWYLLTPLVAHHRCTYCLYFTAITSNHELYQLIQYSISCSKPLTLILIIITHTKHCL